MTDVEDVRRRAWADRPSPAIPLSLLGLVVVGGLIVALIRAAQVHVVAVSGSATEVPAGQVANGFSASDFSLIDGPVPAHDLVRLLYWVIASVVAYLLTLWIARRQGYRGGIWVSRRPLAVAGIAALVVVVMAASVWFIPGDRGNAPLVAIAVGIVAWAIRERRPGLWVVAVIMVPLTLFASFYDTENVLFRLGVPNFTNADEVANLGTVAVVLLVSAAVFAVPHPRHSAATRERGAR